MNYAKSRFIQDLNPAGQCPCGSGLAYAQCHMMEDRGITRTPMPVSTQQQLQLAQAKEELRRIQQGHGKPILSAAIGDQRFVVVGNELINSGEFKTFHDFLHQYLRALFGSEWANVEAKKTAKERHPVMLWNDKMRAVQRQHERGPREVFSTVMTGAISAFTNLSYNLYLLKHNADLLELLLTRLRHKDHFHASFYETLVAAIFIKAGFQIELENENDRLNTHCEFTATWPATGRKYSVEAKMRQPGKADANVRNQLYAALKKAMHHERVVFIELGYPLAPSPELEKRFEEASGSIISAQTKMSIRGVAAPPAYVILTNYSWVLNLDGVASGPTFAGQSFKKDGFHFDPGPRTLDAIVEERDRHIEMYTLVDSMNLHREVPSTFDGDIPEMAYAKEPTQRLIIGVRYDDLPLEEGILEPGILEDAVVLEAEKSAMCTFRADDGRRILAKVPLTDDELSAYSRFPSLFFGKHIGKLKGERPIDLYDWVHDFYSKSTKETLLMQMKNWPDQDKLIQMNQAELAKRYSLMIAEQMLQRSALAKERRGDA